jgi:hypothetical protein
MAKKSVYQRNKKKQEVEEVNIPIVVDTDETIEVETIQEEEFDEVDLGSPIDEIEQYQLKIDELSAELEKAYIIIDEQNEIIYELKSSRKDDSEKQGESIINRNNKNYIFHKPMTDPNGFFYNEFGGNGPINARN